MIHTIRFKAIKIDRRMNIYMRACDLPDIGIEVILTIRSEKEPTDEYKKFLAEKLSEFDDGLHEFVNVKPL